MKLFYLILIFISTQVLFAEKVEITSDSMNAEKLNKEVHFIGNAKVKQLKDWITADEIIVYFNENNETDRYKALGNVDFEFENEKGHYLGSSDVVVYYPMKSLYVLTGKAKVKDLMNKRSAKGDEITVDMLTGHSDVKGTKKKPVKFIFDMEKK